MGQIDNLNQGQLAALIGRVEKLERGTPMNNAAIGRSGFEVYDGGTINVSSGNLIVNGTATISGVLNADGTVTLSGVVNISGPFTVSGATTISGDTDITGDTTVTGDLRVEGPTHLNGPTGVNGDTTVNGTLDVVGAMATTGTLSVEGVTTLSNDLNVTGDGKIVAGDTIIRPSGTINFGDNLLITPDDGFGSAAIKSGASQIVLTPGDANYWAQFTGGAFFQGLVSAMALKLTNLPTTTEPANLYVDPTTGTVKRSTA